MDVANLVGVHEAWIAHHVAAIGEVNGEDGAAAVTDVRRTNLVKAFVVVRRDIAARELLFNPLQKAGIDGHHVFVMAVQGAFFDHPDLAVAFHDLGFDFADLFVHQVAPVFLAGNDGLASFFDAGRAERVCLTREAKGGPGLFPGLQEWLVGPLRFDRGIGIALVEELNRVEGDTRSLAEYPVERPENLRANGIRHTAAASLSKIETFWIPQTQTCLF